VYSPGAHFAPREDTGGAFPDEHALRRQDPHGYGNAARLNARVSEGMMHFPAPRPAARPVEINTMIQCKDCEYYHRTESGEVGFSCDPFTTIKEPECLIKWQLLKINQMVASYQATLDYYRRLAPMQEKMFKVMEREMNDLSEADKWKVDEEGEEDEGLDVDPSDQEEHWGNDDPG